jgi:hypothetical protein
MSDTNINFAKCLQETTDWGVSHIHNVCNGSVTDVPWGSMNYLGAVAAIAGCLLAALVFGSLFTMIIRER